MEIMRRDWNGGGREGGRTGGWVGGEEGQRKTASDVDKLVEDDGRAVGRDWRV